MVMAIGRFARIGADFKWRAGAAPCQVAFLSPSGSTQQTTDPRGAAWSCARQAWRRAAWSRSVPDTPFSSTGPTSVNVTDPASAASTTSWLTSTSPGLA
jgi:hypothetical protein